MNVAEFITKWKRVELKERSAAQEFFIDLCRLVGHPTPAEADPTGENFWATVAERGSFKVGTVRYPRVVPRDAECAARLKDRTLTKLYNARPAWLAACHAKLDAAVCAAYGWPADLSEEQILERLLELNQRQSQKSNQLIRQTLVTAS